MTHIQGNQQKSGRRDLQRSKDDKERCLLVLALSHILPLGRGQGSEDLAKAKHKIGRMRFSGPPTFTAALSTEASAWAPPGSPLPDTDDVVPPRSGMALGLQEEG